MIASKCCRRQPADEYARVHARAHTRTRTPQNYQVIHSLMFSSFCGQCFKETKTAMVWHSGWAIFSFYWKWVFIYFDFFFPSPNASQILPVSLPIQFHSFSTPPPSKKPKPKQKIAKQKALKKQNKTQSLFCVATSPELAWAYLGLWLMWNFTRTMDLFLLNQILSPLFHPLTVPGFPLPSQLCTPLLVLLPPYTILFLLSSSDFPYRLICFCPPNAGIFTFSKKQRVGTG